MSIISHVPKIIGIVACSDPEGVIGVDGWVPWHIKRDMFFFRDLTSGHVVIMGRKTYDSTGYLPRRCNIVLSSHSGFLVESENLRIAHDAPAAFLLSQKWTQQHISDVCIIGGKQIYELFFPWIDIFYVTYVKKKIADSLSQDLLEDPPGFSSQDFVAIPQIIHDLKNENEWTSLRWMSGSEEMYQYVMIRYNRRK